MATKTKKITTTIKTDKFHDDRFFEKNHYFSTNGTYLAYNGSYVDWEQDTMTSKVIEALTYTKQIAVVDKGLIEFFKVAAGCVSASFNCLEGTVINIKYRDEDYFQLLDDWYPIDFLTKVKSALYSGQIFELGVFKKGKTSVLTLEGVNIQAGFLCTSILLSD